MVRPPLRRALFGLASLAALTLPFAARANGRFPAAGQVVVSPTDPTFLALRTTFGVVLSHDGGKTWGWTCEQAIAALGIQEDPTLGLTAFALLAGTAEGLSVSRSASASLGCSWAIGDDTSVVDLVVRLGAPSSALVLRTFYNGDGGALTYATTLASTGDDGATWASLGVAIDPTVTVQTIEVAKSDVARIYISGSRINASGVTEGVLLVSQDSGAHYQTTVISLETDEGAPFLAAVDPVDANRVYVRTNSREPPSVARGDVPNRLLVFTVASDGSATSRAVLTTKSDMLGFALSPDGDKVYVGGPTDGLAVASTSDFAFTKTSSLDVECLTAAGTSVYACSTEATGGFLLGKSDDDGVHFASLLQLGCIDTPLACAPDASAAVCSAPDPSTDVSPNDAFRAQNGALDGGCSSGAGGDAGLDGSSVVADAAAGVVAVADDAGAGLDASSGGGTASGGGGCQAGSASGAVVDPRGVVTAALLAVAAWRRRRGAPHPQRAAR